MAIEIQAKNPVIRLGVPGSGGTSIELDTTLTQSGQAADAKAVGELVGLYVTEV